MKTFSRVLPRWANCTQRKCVGDGGLGGLWNEVGEAHEMEQATQATDDQHNVMFPNQYIFQMV
jgi:hypothetical protein